VALITPELGIFKTDFPPFMHLLHFGTQASSPKNFDRKALRSAPLLSPAAILMLVWLAILAWQNGI